MKKIVAIFILCIYLTQICGYTYVVTTCHCHHHNISTENITEQLIVSNNLCNCKHSHSTEIEQYDVVKVVDYKYIPICTAVFLTYYENNSLQNITKGYTSGFELKIPLSSTPYITTKALRAPPIFLC